MRLPQSLSLGLTALVLILNSWDTIAAENAIHDSRPEMREAFQLLRGNQCAEAIPKFDKVYWTDAEYSNHALFYIVYCQDQLGELGKAQENIQYLKLPLLSSQEQATIQNIRAKEIRPPKSMFINLSSSFGGMTFLASKVYRSGIFYGIAGSWADFTRVIALSYDRTNLVRIGSADIFQDQFAISYGQDIGAYVSSRLLFVKIINNDSLTNTASVYGGSLGVHSLLRDLSLGPDFYYSNYSNYVSGGLRVVQLGLGGSLQLSFLGSPSTYLSLKAIGLRAIVDSTPAQGAFNQNLYSGELGLITYFSSSSLSLGGWYGRQFFGVQNDGSTILNVALERSWGVKMNFSYVLSPVFRLGIFGSLDSVTEGTTKSQVLSGGGSLNVSF